MPHKPQYGLGTRPVPGYSDIHNYLRARYYDPATAQLLTIDPLVAQTMSPYAYTAGNPVNATDPTGDQVWGWQQQLGSRWGVPAGYAYSWNEMIGLGSKVGSPKHVAHNLEQHGGSLFPFSTGRCSAFVTVGQRCLFWPGAPDYLRPC